MRKRFDAELSSGEQQELGDLIRRRPALARQYVAASTLEVLLRNRMKAEAGAAQAARSSVGILLQGRWRRNVAWMAAAAALLMLCWLWAMRVSWPGTALPVVRQAPSPGLVRPLLVVRAAGDVFVKTNENCMVRAVLGDLLGEGTLVLTGNRNSACTLQLENHGVQMDLDAASSLIWRGESTAAEDGLAVELLSGRITSSVDPMKGVKYTVRTALGFARAIGTHFTVALIQTGTTGGDGVKNQSSMTTRVASGIVLVGSLTGFTNLVQAGESVTIPSVMGEAVQPTRTVHAAKGAATAAAAEISPPGKKLRAIVIPEVSFQDARFADVVAFLNLAAKENDPEKVGVPVVLEQAVEKMAPLSLHVRSVRLGALLDVIASMEGVNVDVESDRVVLRKH